ncbi:MAG: hypothetical protein P1U63_07050 [Coxiellaceae bacterium]|nr:hypothetical protein [Coxiellaceae bacterium]
MELQHLDVSGTHINASAAQAYAAQHGGCDVTFNNRTLTPVNNHSGNRHIIFNQANKARGADAAEQPVPKSPGMR